MKSTTDEQTETVVRVVTAVVMVVRVAGRVPMGTLHATLLDRLTAAEFHALIDVVIRTGMVRREGHWLIRID